MSGQDVAPFLFKVGCHRRAVCPLLNTPPTEAFPGKHAGSDRGKAYPPLARRSDPLPATVQNGTESRLSFDAQ